MMSVGFVILNYNDFESVDSTVAMMRKNGITDRICIVDNCSTDGSYKELCNLKNEDTDVISSGKNGGYAFGNNVGSKFLIEYYGVDIIFIANPDTEFSLEAIEAIKKGFSMYPKYAVLTAVMHEPSGSVSTRPYIYIPSYVQNLLSCFYIYNKIYRISHSCQIDYKQKIINIDMAQGSFFAIRADIFEEIGYLDEGTFLFYEEMCLAMRIKQYDSSLKIGMLTEQSYIHYNSVTIKSNISQMKTYRIFMESKMYFEKTYHNIGKTKQRLLRAAIGISCFEKRIQLSITNNGDR